MEDIDIKFSHKTSQKYELILFIIWVEDKPLETPSKEDARRIPLSGINTKDYFG